MNHAADGDRVGEQLRRLPELPLAVDGVEFACVEKGVPVREIDLLLLHLRTRILEFFKEAPGAQIMVICIDFAQDIANLDVGFKVIGPVLLAAGHGNAAVGTFEFDMSRSKTTSLWFSRLWIIWSNGSTGLTV